MSTATITRPAPTATDTTTRTTTRTSAAAPTLADLRTRVADAAADLGMLDPTDPTVGFRATDLIAAIAPIVAVPSGRDAQVVAPTTVALRELLVAQRLLARVTSASSDVIARALLAVAEQHPSS